MYDRRSNIVNPTQKEAQTFGYSKDLITLSLSLSQVLTYNNLYIIKTRGHPRKYTAFLAIGKGSRLFFYPHSNYFLNIEEYED